ncbi:hypothetical protein D1818_16525 [Aquimarina sp. BL5]|uniref:hypothetical protein n=1 Tax=Aquimarina sp. BL5 TaxID=1714860 RepID=UPI000E53D51E|nr:hypothetical protein [Aquimarina sp. BL5]AXT52366.1 hypothetical protein D1818_16525 [Aquimarina sp. BL5]RKN10280.1 hypothetical protein D7036_02905 [Aquimarina sp. BL5]
MDTNTIQLELTITEANMILAALGQQLYIKVADLIQKIQQQEASQLKSHQGNGLIANNETFKTAIADGQ